MPNNSTLSAVYSRMANIPANSVFEECTVNVMLPTYDLVKISFYRSNNHDARVLDLKNQVSEVSNGIDPRRMRLLYNYMELRDTESLMGLKLTPQDTLQVVYKMIDVDVERTQMEYAGFIRQVTPEDGAAQVSVNSSIVIHVGPNQFNHVIRIAALLNHTMLPLEFNGNMLSHFKGKEQLAADRGYQQWTDHTLMERIMLLEVDDHFDLEADSIRYYTHGINGGYCFGDYNSWQRYTKSYPIECKITVQELEDASYNIITMKPYQPLKYNTHYAILLCNNVPTVPAALLDAPWTGFTMGGTNEDKLFLFKTEIKQK